MIKTPDNYQLSSLKNTTRVVGRPKAITPEVVRELVSSIRHGCDIKSACILSGISTSTYYSEIKNNKHFSDKMTIVHNETIFYAHSLIKEAIEKRGDLKTARWLIDRQDRLERKALRAREYRLIKKLTLTRTKQETQSVEFETGTITD